MMVVAQGIRCRWLLNAKECNINSGKLTARNHHISVKINRARNLKEPDEGQNLLESGKTKVPFATLVPHPKL